VFHLISYRPFTCISPEHSVAIFSAQLNTLFVRVEFLRRLRQQRPSLGDGEWLLA
jgi:hypothetical protein